MTAAARSKIGRRENRFHELIDTVLYCPHSTKSTQKRGQLRWRELMDIGQLTSEAQILYTEIDDLAVLDPGLADRAEKLHCAATLSGLCHLSLKVTP